MTEKENAHCYGCDGKGWFCDSTYDRSGVNVSCKACYGTGLPAHRVSEIIREAMLPYRKEVPHD